MYTMTSQGNIGRNRIPYYVPYYGRTVDPLHSQQTLMSIVPGSVEEVEKNAEIAKEKKKDDLTNKPVASPDVDLIGRGMDAQVKDAFMFPRIVPTSELKAAKTNPKVPKPSESAKATLPKRPAVEEVPSGATKRPRPGRKAKLNLV